MEIKLLNGEALERNRVDSLLKKQIKLNLKSLILSNYSSGVIETIATVWGLILLGYGALLVINDVLTLGTLIAFLTLASQLFMPLNTFINLSLGFQPVIVSLNRIYELLALPKQKWEKPSVPDNCTGNSRNNYNIPGKDIIRLKFENVSFSYSKTTILDKIDCEIPFKEKLFIIGSNGSGKSSLCRLLAGVYPTLGGKIYINGKQLLPFYVDACSYKILLLTHEPYFFKGTIWNNLIYGIEKTPFEEDAIDALKRVKMDMFVSALPLGINTTIIDQGGNLSNGQKLRLHCARAILRRPDILILDEVLNGIEEGDREYVLTELAKESFLIVTATHVDSFRTTDHDRMYTLSGGKLHSYDKST